MLYYAPPPPSVGVIMKGYSCVRALTSPHFLRVRVLNAAAADRNK